ncbi:hypothetical protein Ahia01_000294400 [Argonauta hians]
MDPPQEHWFQKLFRPTFQYSEENFSLICNSKYIQDQGVTGGELNPIPETSEGEEMKHVYQIVAELNKAQKMADSKNLQYRHDLDSSGEKSVSKTKTSDKNIFWIPSELNNLRSHLKSIEKENRELKVKLQMQESYVKELEERVQAINRECNEAKDLISSLKKDNEQQHILIETLKTELWSANMTVKNLYETNTEILEDCEKQMYTNSKLRVLLNKNQIEYENKVRVLENDQQQVVKELELHIGKLESDYQSKLKSLRKLLIDYQNKYTQQLQQHSESQKELQKLVQHFLNWTPHAGQESPEEHLEYVV